MLAHTLREKCLPTDFVMNVSGASVYFEYFSKVPIIKFSMSGKLLKFFYCLSRENVTKQKTTEIYSLLNVLCKLYSKWSQGFRIYLKFCCLRNSLGSRRDVCLCIYNVFALKHLIQKYREFNLEICLVFMDYEKAFNYIHRFILKENRWKVPLDIQIAKH